MTTEAKTPQRKDLKLPAPRMTPESIRKGRLPEPDRILIYGVEKVGKSTFAAAAPEPVFIAADKGIGHLDVAKFPEPRTFDEVLECVKVLGTTDLPYRTLVIDPIGWVEHLIRAEICKQNSWTDAQFQDYSRGFKIAIPYHLKLIAHLDRLRSARAMQVIATAHAEVAEFKNPEGENYMRYKPQMFGDKAVDVWKQWADSILFLNWETTIKKGEDGGKVSGRNKGVGTGNRTLACRRQAAFDAGNRWNIPDQIMLEDGADAFAAYAAARAEGGVYVAAGGGK